MSVSDLPELAAVETGVGGVRIPPDVTVPLTPRVRRLLDTAELRRLARISQLGLVALVYPGAVHTRLEHSLGAYRLALEFLRRLARDDRFVAAVGEADASAFVAAALLHDVGHWPYCHPIEDLGLPELPRHESLVPAIVSQGDMAAVLADDWGLAPARVAELITGTATDPAAGILETLLSGPIDIDKMDYLARDSLHAGVPYGRHFDQERLLSALCLDAAGRSLAITDKGRTAAELMVFARYVMFSEVYWHHAVRAATAMLQRAVWVVRERLDPPRLVRQDDAAFHAWLTAAAASEPCAAGPPPARPRSRSSRGSSDRPAGCSSGRRPSTPSATRRSTPRSPAAATLRWSNARDGWPRPSPAGSGSRSIRTRCSWTPRPRPARSSFASMSAAGRPRAPPSGTRSPNSHRWCAASPIGSSTNSSSGCGCSPIPTPPRRSPPAPTWRPSCATRWLREDRLDHGRPAHSGVPPGSLPCSMSWPNVGAEALAGSLDRAATSSSTLRIFSTFFLSSLSSRSASWAP